MPLSFCSNSALTHKVHSHLLQKPHSLALQPRCPHIQREEGVPKRGTQGYQS
jgi:hypothetical protein